jgi:integrase
MASLRKRGHVWFYRYVDGDGVQRERRGCGDRRETEGLAAAAEAEAAKVRAGFVSAKDLGWRTQEARPIDDHLSDWHADMIARGRTCKHADLSRNRASRVLGLSRARKISDLTPSRVQAALARIRDEGLSVESINHHVRAVKGFARWLWRDNRAREHSLAHLATSSPESDRRHRRRALTPNEAALVIEAAERGPLAMGMTGPDRAMLYALALATGLRASELASLTPERFDLDGDPPTIICRAAYTKNGREAVQPVPPALARRLGPWISTRPADAPVFALPTRTAALLRIDLHAAGIDYETPEGFADFHSLRSAYVTNLLSGGASLKTAQTLARHSSPNLTIARYAKASLHDIAGAVAGLPDPTVATTRPEAVAATGTDGRHTSKRFALPLPYGGGGKGRALSVAGDPGDSEASPGTSRKLLVGSALGGEGRPESGPVVSSGGGIRTPDTRIMIPLRSTTQTPVPAKPSRPIDDRQSLPVPYGLDSPPNLAEIVAAWPDLPEPIRAGVMALVRSAVVAGKS